MTTNVLDKQVLLDLTAKKAQLEKKFAEISDSLENDYNTDGWESDDSKMVKYTRDNMYHGQVQRELKQVNDEIDRVMVLTPPDPKSKQAEVNDAFQRFLLKGVAGLDKDEQEKYIYDNGHGDVFKLKSAASRSDDSSGQKLTDITTQARVLDALDYYGGVSLMCQIFNTSNGNEIRIPTHSDAEAKGVLVEHQDSDVGERRMPDFDEIKFGAEQMTTKVVPIARELIQDSVIDITSYARREVGRQMSRGWDELFTNGNANKIPNEVDGAPATTKAPQTDVLLGVANVAQDGHTTAEAGKVKWQDLIKTIHSINRAYRTGMEGMNGLSAETGGRIGWLISDEFEAAMKMMTDDDGRPMWQALNLGIGSNLMSPAIAGYPYEVSGSLPAVTSGQVPALFGNFSYYAIRRVNDLEFFSFFDAKTAIRNRIELIGYSRCFGRALFPAQGVRGTTANKTKFGGIPQISKLTIK